MFIHFHTGAEVQQLLKISQQNYIAINRQGVATKRWCMVTRIMSNEITKQLLCVTNFGWIVHSDQRKKPLKKN